MHLVDAQVGYRADGYEIVLYGANIFDKRYIANIYDFSSTPASAIGAPGDRATYGLRVKYTF